ncbi:thiamine phosphate synthase [Virgibacillus sp. 179-BFC.A HS]|uniref:Thiamine-phosphate synthase n=1 Tax=Tigheibacillus jepli TaxID=3035914 RepID=A0ABU5CIE4_9BACI|nr:thiamine phosphate synthase [Virgibacillus sp. 179-BFC.A HS]MDY0406114.1 thiamine phosphate synthase [Virgibacillus sp. 179-BFC.A HS]
MKFDRNWLRKYFIMGSQNCNGKDPATILEAAIAGGITAFQFREKGKGALSGDAKIRLGKKLRDICRNHHIPFIINDDVALVDILRPDGIHVGQDDVPIIEIKRKFPDLPVGLSVSTEIEAARSPLNMADYIGAGPVFTTASKEDAKEATGLAWIETLRHRYPDLPIVGIGGINQSNAASVIAAGADGVSVISAIANANNIQQAVAKL